MTAVFEASSWSSLRGEAVRAMCGVSPLACSLLRPVGLALVPFSDYLRRMPPRSRPSASIFEIEIRLREIKPVVWRRLLVPASIRLGALHSVLNETMGWTNSHLHSFKLDERSFGDPRLDPDGELDFEDERKVKLDSLIDVGAFITYEYDFGDSWEHDVRVLRRRESDDRLHYPLCVAGARACPPEDCGGAHGYELLLRSLGDEKHPEHDESLTWVGGLFDPEGFDVNRTNHALHTLRLRL
jgi:hypothetical protein